MCSRKGVLAKWYKTGNCAVEAVDLGRREERTRRSNEGDKRGSSSLPSLFLFFYFFLCLPLALSLLRVLDTREFRLASALTLLSIVHRPVVLSSHLRPSSSCLRSEQSEAETRRASFSQTADLVSPIVDAAVPSFSCSIFLSYPSPPPFVDNTIALTTLSFVLALDALFPLPFSPFSIVSHFEYFPSSTLPLLLFISFFLTFFSSQLSSLSFFLCPFFHFISFFLCLSCLSFSFFSICIPRAKYRRAFFFSFRH